ncbi:amino acid ABC transporter substrate-binding protein (PAAT family) [Crenobacter luteus]|nr:amino acid ABC transporter substrate-binding protein (PAAT family) [Crenobacter luteus]
MGLQLFAGLALGLWLATSHAATPLAVAVGIDKPPYVEAGGQSGLEVEIARAALLRAGFRPAFRPLPPSRGLEQLGQGRVGAMLSLAPGARPGLYYSQPLLHYHNRAIFRAADRLVLRDVADLARYRVAAFQNAHALFGPRYAEVVSAHPAYREYGDQSLLGPLLYRGRVDVVIADVDVFATQEALRGHTPCTRPRLALADILPPSPRHAAFARAADRDAFDRALSALRAEGALTRLRQRFLIPRVSALHPWDCGSDADAARDPTSR